MTEQEQRIALAEWMGWKNNGKTLSIIPHWLSPDGTHEVLFDNLPDTNSLDALHGMVLKLREQDGKKYLRYHQRLVKMDGLFYPDATATQRREALLRTLGLWKD